MKTKLVNKKVIFALVMSLALVLSYSSFAFAKTEAPKVRDNAQIQNDLKDVNARLNSRLAKAEKKLADVQAGKYTDATIKLGEAKDKAAEAKEKADKAVKDAKDKNAAIEAAKAADEKAKSELKTANDELKEATEKLNAANQANPKVQKDVDFAKQVFDKANKKVNDLTKKAAEAKEALDKLGKPVTGAEIEVYEDRAKAADEALTAAEEAYNTAKDNELTAAENTVDNLKVRIAEVAKLLKKIAAGVKVDNAEVQSIIGQANAAIQAFDKKQEAANPAANPAKPQAKPATKGNGPQTADAQELAAYALGLVLVSAGAVYTFRKRNLNK